MEIKIGVGWYIDKSKRSLALKQKYIGTTKDGKKVERVKIHGYPGSLEDAVKTYLEINQVPSRAKMSVDLLEYVKLVEESNKMAVSSLCKLIEGKETEIN